ncbi:MAG: glycosyltransferase family 39 protein [Candidatus Microgenomates bacterium]
MPVTNLLKRNLLLIAIMLVALFFYTFRIHQTFIMASDTARDLIRVMEIWQGKIITAIGPPVNTISNNPIQVYFGSMHYYFGLLGLLLSNFDPVGSVYINIALTFLSIPFFFLLSKEILKKRGVALLSTFVYALSPITIALARSYWNPNLIIPLSVFVWFLFLYKKSLVKYFLAGIVSGIIFNLHYMNIIPIALFIVFLFFKTDKRYLLSVAIGFILATSPLIAFELKNHFFLIKAFIGTFGGFSAFSGRTPNPFLSIDTFFHIFGLGPYQYFFPSQVNITFGYRIIMDTVIGIAFVYFLIKKQKIINFELVCVILTGLLVGWYFEEFHLVGLRYILSTYPLFIISFVAFVSSFGIYIILVPIIPMLILSVKIITHKLDPNSQEDYYPVQTVEEISKAIVADSPTGKYNVTENILGDARSLSFRYFLMRDAKVKPQSVEVYDRIDTLYVVTPSLDKTYKEDRWEFVASGPKKISWEKDFGDLKLYKFIK